MNGGLGVGCRTDLQYCVFCKNNNEDVKVCRGHKIKAIVQCFMHLRFRRNNIIQYLLVGIIIPTTCLFNVIFSPIIRNHQM